MKKLIYLIMAIAALGLIVAGCGLPVVPPTEQNETSSLTKGGITWTVGPSGCNFTTIQEAIDAAANGDTIIIAAGTYTNDPYDSFLSTPDSYRITKSVTLLGAQVGVDPQGNTNRGEETILVRTNGTPYSLYVSNITIDGVTFTSGGGSGGGRLIIACDTDSVTIKNCIIKDISGIDPHGVWVCSTATNALIDQNTFYNTAWEAIRCDGNAVISNNTIKDIPFNKGIFLGGAGGAQVIDNVITRTFYEGIQATAQTTITGNDISECYIGIQVRDSASGSFVSYNTISNTTYEGIQALASATIIGNEISGCSNGIQIRNHATGTVIKWNNICDNTYHGIEIPNYDFTGETFVTGATITNNTFTNNGYTGIKIGGGADGSGININYNGFEGNVYFGVEAAIVPTDDPSLYVDATRNWWGHASGPGGEFGRTNPAGKIIGKGDAVSDYVNWDPWLSQPTVPPTQILNKWDLVDTFEAHPTYDWGGLAEENEVEIDGETVIVGATWEYSIHIKEAMNGDFSVGSIHFSTGDINVIGIVEQTKRGYNYGGWANYDTLAVAGRTEYNNASYNFMLLYCEKYVWLAISSKADLEPYWTQETVWPGSLREYQLHSLNPGTTVVWDPKNIH